jgi:dTDP-4-dehydrorhamnose 3,5-epimerase
MRVTVTNIPYARLANPRRGDVRGFFAELFRVDVPRVLGIKVEVAQDNQAFSTAANAARGLHFQTPPASQAKLLRVVAGAAIDVVIGLRHGSPTHGGHIGLALRAQTGTDIVSPERFGLGYRTSVPNTGIICKVNRYCLTENHRGPRRDEPALRIAPGSSADREIVSDNDRRQPLFAELGR